MGQIRGGDEQSEWCRGCPDRVVYINLGAVVHRFQICGLHSHLKWRNEWAGVDGGDHGETRLLTRIPLPHCVCRPIAIIRWKGSLHRSSPSRTSTCCARDFASATNDLRIFNVVPVHQKFQGGAASARTRPKSHIKYDGDSCGPQMDSENILSHSVIHHYTF